MKTPIVCGIYLRNARFFNALTQMNELQRIRRVSIKDQ